VAEIKGLDTADVAAAVADRLERLYGLGLLPA